MRRAKRPFAELLENIDAAFLRPGRFTYVIEVDPPSAAELAEIWLIHLEAAASRAKRLDFLTDPLMEAVLADRQEWVSRAFQAGDDPAGILRLATLSEEERASYMELYGMKELGIQKVIRVGYDILGLITFYTVVGKEMRAWTIPRGTTAYEAAGRIHSDMQRGFIRAEAISYDDFVMCGSEHAAREKGLIHVEGKEYVVKDGDILHIRFNV